MYCNKRKKNVHAKSAVLVLCLILVLSLTSGVTFAYLVTKTDSIENKFLPSKVTTEIEETFDGKIKKNVRIKNTGDIEAWIRASVVITWQDTDGNVYGQAPVEEKDYKISYNLNDAGWLKGDDGFYYWSSPVAPTDPADPAKPADGSNFTDVLITECKLVDDANVPDEYTLTVEVIGSGIQSLPVSVFAEMWAGSGLKVDTNANKLVKNDGSQAGGAEG